VAEALAEWAASAHCVNYVVGCDSVEGVVGSGTFCAILLLGSLHLALLGSWRRAQFVGKKTIVISVYIG